jgi:hypothetical protein
MLIDGKKLMISVSCGKFIIDAADARFLCGYNWRIFKIGNTSYVKSFSYSNGKPRKTFYLHRLLLDLKNSPLVVDHIDGDGLNNSRSNLRVLTRGQNAARTVNGERNQFTGLSKEHGLYYVRLKHNNVAYHIGKYSDPVIAAMAYDKAALELRGELAILNFPDLVDQHHNIKLRDYKNGGKK